MQNWDRWALFVVGLAVSVYIGRDGYKLWKRQKYLGVAGVAILILATLGVPVALALLVT